MVACAPIPAVLVPGLHPHLRLMQSMTKKRSKTQSAVEGTLFADLGILSAANGVDPRVKSGMAVEVILKSLEK